MTDALLTPSRLRLARERRRMTLASLGKAMEVTPRTVTRWESGQVPPSAEVVRRLASTLELPVSYFYAQEVEELPVGAVSFRALSKTSAGLRDSAISAGRIATEIGAWLDSRFRLPKPDVPTLAGYQPEVAAAAVRERWGIGVEPIPNVTHLLEAHGVRVFSLAMDVQEIDAFSFYRNGTPYALVNTTKTGERQRFDLAHELGHLVMHCEHHEITSSREAEQQAQRFAAAFLMPREDVLAQPLWYADVAKIIKFKRRWRVAAMALTHRLKELGMLTEWGYRDACVLLSQAGYRRGEPEKAITPELSQVLGKAFIALRDRGESSLDIAANLHLTVEELNRFIFGLVPVAIDGGGQGGGKPARLRLVPSASYSTERSLLNAHKRASRYTER